MAETRGDRKHSFSIEHPMLTEDTTLLTSFFFSDNHNYINQSSLEGDLVNPEDIKREIVPYYDTE